MAKTLISLIFLFLSLISNSQVKSNATKLNPTGVYNLVTGDKDSNHAGTISVKLLGNSKITIALEIGMGGLAENNGSLRDTLRFSNNTAIYKCPEYDSTCTIILKFTSKGVRVNEKASNPNFECGFGHGVTAQGYYIKTSSKKPKDSDLKWH